MAAPTPTQAICHQTKVRNMTGKTAFFGFLPVRGKRLAPGEEYVFNGDLRQFYAGVTKGRHRKALLAAITGPDPALVIVSTPSQHVYDDTLDVTKILTVVNGSVTTANPCGGAYSSSIDGADHS